MLTISEESTLDVIARYEAKGYTGQFTARADAMLHCHHCGADEPAAQAPLLATHRLEGSSDPGDQSVIAAVECPSCGGHGTIALPYGPAASQEEAAILAELLDDRDQSSIKPGI